MTIRTSCAILSLILAAAVVGGHGRTRQLRTPTPAGSTRRVRRDRRLARTRLAGCRRCPAGPVRLAVHATADRDPGPVVAPDPAGERAGRGRTAARPHPARPSRRAGRRANPGDRAEARLHHGALLHRHDRRALADRRDRARQPLPAAGPGGRAGSGQSRRRPSALSGAPTSLSRRQRGGDAGRSRRAVGARLARHRRPGRLPGRYPPRHARAERRSGLAGAARRASTPAIRCCSACSAAPCRRTPNGLPSRAAATKAAPGGRAAICCWSPAHICFRPAPGQPNAAPAAAGPTACRTPRRRS